MYSMFLVTALILAAIALLLYLHVAFLLAYLFKRNDIVDVAWGPGFLVVAMAGFISAGIHPAGVLIASMVALWALRLSWHIFNRLLKNPEDGRYQRWRIAWGRYATVRTWAQVFLLQGLLLFMVALPVAVVTADPVSSLLSIPLIVGSIIWLCGFLFETIADWQLSTFLGIPENRNHVLAKGLWRLSCHPNYFGEIVQWWGIGIIALGSPYGIVGFVGPLLITYLILKVSGVPLLEERYKDNQEYQQYKKTSNTILPWPQKR